MEKLSILVLIFAVNVNCGFGSSISDVLTLPSIQTEYLSKLFNVTIDKLEDFVSRFAFSTDVKSSDIAIIDYKSDNTSVSYKLSELEGSHLLKDGISGEIVIIIHGYLSSGTVDWVASMAQEYHKLSPNISVLAVSWKDTADRNYFASAQATKNVGELVANWIWKDLIDFNTTILPNIHLVGHSLGAHVSGFIGKTIYVLSNGNKVGRISGLDVARPLFEYPTEKSSDQRFCSTDAVMVEAYHTNKGFLGYVKPVAQQDFYVNNGGPYQPSCLKSLDVSCSHGYSHEIFTDAISSLKYTSKKCKFALVDIEKKKCPSKIVVIMGEHNNGTGISGVFYGYTNKIEARLNF